MTRQGEAAVRARSRIRAGGENRGKRGGETPGGGTVPGDRTAPGKAALPNSSPASRRNVERPPGSGGMTRKRAFRGNTRQLRQSSGPHRAGGKTRRPK
jgi:hypothetical protein